MPAISPHISLPIHDVDEEDEIRRLLALPQGEKIYKEIALARARERARTRDRLRGRDYAEAREAAAAAKQEIKEVLELMDPLPGRISELLSPGSEAWPGRIMAEAGARRGLAFLEKELRTIVAALRQLAVSPVLGPDHVDSSINDRLAHLKELAGWTKDILDRGQAPLRAADLPELNLAWIEQLLLVDGSAGRRSSARMVVPSDNEPAELLQQPDRTGNPQLVGMDGPSKKLHRWLVSAADGEEADKSSLRVISIVGPPGVGKTTLAMELHRQTGGQYFQCHAVVRMSRQPPDTGNLLRHIMLQITDSEVAAAPETSECPQDMAALVGDEHELAYDMNKYLQDKRYLIVVDDLWRTSDWEIIEDAFPHNKCGSRILITTRIRSVARSCCSRNKDGLTEFGETTGNKKTGGNDELFHELKPLGKVDSERLFSEAAFGVGRTCPSEHSRQASDEILRRCDGIPLFIIAMADLMRQEQAEGTNRTAAYWLEQIPELKLVQEALSPSYHDLPDELKLLALYMSTLPRDYMIDKHRLMRKWGAEGLITPNMWRASEEMAEEYFSKLYDRGIIRPMDRRSDSEVATCWEVDHFMHQFLGSLSTHKNFAATSHTLKLKAEVGAGGGDEVWILQRLSLHQHDLELQMLLEGMDFSHTRSLTVSGVATRIPFHKFVHLAVLDLEGWGKLNNDDLEHICSSKFFLLKYLSIRNTGVSKLPPQIAELGYLETLDISYTKINELPLEVLELPELRVLDLRCTQVSLLSRYNPCLLPCLRHLHINGHTPDETVTVVPEDIVDWGFLETLETVDLSNCSPSFIKDLAKLRFLEVLAVTWSFHQCYNEEHQRALRSAIQRSVCLKSLTIHCEVGCSMEFLDLLPDAPQSLQHLRITARFHTVPKWIEGLNHLVFLDITVCKLALDGIKLLGSLERLESLVLGLDFLQEEAILIGYEGFHQLQRLFINCRVPWLDFGKGAMSRLTDLDLIISTGPVGQDSQLTGIANLLSLEQVTLSYDPWYINCHSVKAAVGAIWRQVAETGYTVKFVNNGIEEDVCEQSLQKHAKKCPEIK